MKPWLLLFCIGLVTRAGPAAATPAAPASPGPSVRFGYTRSVVRNASENDFRSAMRAYSRLISATNEINPATDSHIFASREEIINAFTTDAVNLVTGSASEILTLPDELVERPFLAAMAGGVIGAEYVLLVNQDSGLRNLADLSGHRLLWLDSTYGALIEPWLDHLLRDEKLPAAKTFLREIKPVPKPSLAALPVFFGQWDACVITVANFATLVELNPQLKRKLHPLAVSPRLVPIVTAFRQGLDPALRKNIMRNIDAIGTTTNGRQILTLFQTDALQLCTDADLVATRQLLSGQPVPPGTMNRLAAPNPAAP